MADRTPGGSQKASAKVNIPYMIITVLSRFIYNVNKNVIFLPVLFTFLLCVSERGLKYRVRNGC